MNENVEIRVADLADVPEIARHRAAMFVEMGTLAEDLAPAMRAATERYLPGAMAAGEFVGWMAHERDEPRAIVAGAVVQRRRVLPFPIREIGGASRVSDGHEALVLNVYTAAPWRRRGVARRLMAAVIAWARQEKMERLVLHASREGRPLYEDIGFSATNEMRFEGDLSSTRDQAR